MRAGNMEERESLSTEDSTATQGNEEAELRLRGPRAGQPIREEELLPVRGRRDPGAGRDERLPVRRRARPEEERQQHQPTGGEGRSPAPQPAPPTVLEGLVEWFLNVDLIRRIRPPGVEDELLAIRRRRSARPEDQQLINEVEGQQHQPMGADGRSSNRQPAPLTVLEGSHWLCRILLLRALALVYCVAFWVAFFQNTQLIGDRGLLPCKLYLESIKRYYGGKITMDCLSYAPTLLWLLPWTCMDWNLNGIAFLGFLISAYILVTGCANMVCMSLLWIFYLSLIYVGQIWYAFGSDTLLLETGFLGIFLCPLWTLSSLPKHTPTSPIVIWAFRWLIFRLMFGAGVNKLAADPCWTNFTCMYYHYETQPLPTPASYYLHHLAGVLQVFLCFMSLVFELILPFLMIMGRRLRALHGVLQISFQVLQILSGNLGFLSWLTAVPSIACFDDASLAVIFPSGHGSIKDQAMKLAAEKSAVHAKHGRTLREYVNIGLAVLIAYLSIPALQSRLMSPQVRDTVLSPLRIVNTYSTFSRITKVRTEIVFQGTSSPDPKDPSALWEEYDFKCKPGDLKKMPCFLSPFHYRLDWLMWYAALQTYEQHEWVIHLAGKLLADGNSTSLLASNPFMGKEPPRWIRGEHFRYKFTKRGGKHAVDGKWWHRKRIGPYFPPVNLEGLKRFFEERGWAYPPQH